LAQYRDMQAFAMFASDLDAASRRQLDRGARLTELLRQGQYAPYPVEDQVVSVWAGNEGHFDDIPVADVLRFEQEYLDHLRHNTSVLQNIAGTKLFGDADQAAALQALADFKRVFRTSDGKMLVGREEHRPLEDSEIGQEQIVRQKRA
ncbi:MAG TPA: F0F1 ATP synthase subunit alpha, partial [Arachnia sp.]|nr:F0F1 ATP synthase subunit alpha [Arachnia sp.]